MAEHSGASYSQLWFKMGVPLRNNFQENFISEDPRESLGNYSLYNAIFCGSYPHYLAPQYLIVQTALKSFGQLFIHLGLKYYFYYILSIVPRLEFQRLYENLLTIVYLENIPPVKIKRIFLKSEYGNQKIHLQDLHQAMFICLLQEMLASALIK